MRIISPLYHTLFPYGTHLILIKLLLYPCLLLSVRFSTVVHMHAYTLSVLSLSCYFVLTLGNTLDQLQLYAIVCPVCIYSIQTFIEKKNKKKTRVVCYFLATSSSVNTQEWLRLRLASYCYFTFGAVYIRVCKYRTVIAITLLWCSLAW